MAYQPNCVDGEKLASGGKMVKLKTGDGPTNTRRCKYYIEQPDGLILTVLRRTTCKGIIEATPIIHMIRPCLRKTLDS
jgi:hypothetical protein